MSLSQFRRVMRARTNLALLGGVNHKFYSPARAVPDHNDYQSTRIHDQSRFEDEPEPTEDDMISKYFHDKFNHKIEIHYLKHHP